VSDPPIDKKKEQPKRSVSILRTSLDGAWKGVPEYNEAAAHLTLYSASGVTPLPSDSDVNDGTAVPAAYDNGCQHTSSSKFNDTSRSFLVHRDSRHFQHDHQLTI
jgi:hypothetical protein